MSNFSIASAQLNFVVGDMQGNARKIIDAAAEAVAQGAQLLLTPELAICGYAAEDLFQRPSFLAACEVALQTVVDASSQWPELTIVVGHPKAALHAPHGRCYNVASVVRGGQLLASYRKQLLPNYREFDETRYFVEGAQTCVFDVAGTQVGLLICEDAWASQPARAARAAGAQVLAVINASPFQMDKVGQREQVVAERVRETGLPLVYTHLVGGQDELVFDGHSFAMNADGSVAARAPGFDEKLLLTYVDTSGPAIKLSGEIAPQGDTNQQLWHALVLAVRDYLGKSGFPGAVLGLSGGIDSALVLAIAVDAIGADKVRTVMMPSPYTADISWIDACDMAKRLGVQYEEISIAPMFESFKAALAQDFAGRPEDTTEENLQARIRGTLLMALSNKFGSIVLTTGNKSEMATGYCTLYGDMAGGFAVIRDVLKTRVFELARWRNANDPFGTGREPIPERIITRPPSAELRPDQKDQDSLPPYEVLDAIIVRYMEQDADIDSIVAAGYARADVERVVRLIRVNEYKRRQAAVGPRLSARGFGRDWRYPITNGFRG
ncbi:NAD+ synthase [Comamonas testosteroni]